MSLTEDARKEIREAIRIVREDRFEKFVRTRSTPPAATVPEAPTSSTDKAPTGSTPEAPPVKVGDDPVVEVKSKKYSHYWGEILDD